MTRSLCWPSVTDASGRWASPRRTTDEERVRDRHPKWMKKYSGGGEFRRMKME